MKLRIIRIRAQLRSSLWFIPSLGVVLAFLLAEVSMRIDQQLEPGGGGWFLFGGGVRHDTW